MNIEIKLNNVDLNRNQIKVGDVAFKFDCSEAETLDSNRTCMDLLENPAISNFLNKLTQQVSFAPRHNDAAQKQSQDRQQAQQARHDGNLRRTIDILRHNQKVLEDRIDAIRKNNLGL